MSYLTKIRLALKTIKNFPVFLLDYFGFLHRDVTYGIRTTGQKMIARGGTNDCKEIIVVMSGHEYALDRLPPLNNPVIFDVGAHLGSFGLYALHYYRGQAPRLFAFEPDQENFRYLQKNFQLNAIPEKQYTLFHCALGDYEGTGKLDKSKANDAYKLAENPQGAYDVCSVRALPAVAEELGIKTFDILKLDIEGGEYRLLRHEPTFEFIKNHVRYLLLEHHFVDSLNNVNWIIERLHNHFDLLLHRGDVLTFKNRKTITIDTPSHSIHSIF